MIRKSSLERLAAGCDPTWRLVALFALLLVHGASWTEDLPAAQRTLDGPATEGVGLLRNESGAFEGYTLLSPLQSTTTYLMDMEGRVVHTWETDSTPSSLAYLLENGNLLRAGVDPDQRFGGAAGGGGRIQEFDWDGKLVWDYRYSSETTLPHHDFARLPNGNVVLIVKERKTAPEAVAAGRVAASVEGSEVQADSLVEIRPTGPTSGEVVWEWHLWDHLIQDHDPDRANYGDVAGHPERVDINFAGNMRLTGEAASGNQRISSDWTHGNAVAYNEELDQLVLSAHAFNEIWIIDHSTTTEEAASGAGGRGGRGGDLLYRWGNPVAYRQGTPEDQRLFGQHDAHWIPRGLRGEGHLLLFNNGYRRPSGEEYSTVDELVLPVDSDGRYRMGPDNRYGPDRPVWRYSAPNLPDFYSFNISGASRLPNGNTLICAGAPGIMFEVTSEGEVVWQYMNPSHAEDGRANGRGVFRAYRYAPDFPGLAGRALEPGKPLEEVASDVASRD